MATISPVSKKFFSNWNLHKWLLVRGQALFFFPKTELFFNSSHATCFCTIPRLRLVYHCFEYNSLVFKWLFSALLLDTLECLDVSNIKWVGRTLLHFFYLTVCCYWIAQKGSELGPKFNITVVEVRYAYELHLRRNQYTSLFSLSSCFSSQWPSHSSSFLLSLFTKLVTFARYFFAVARLKSNKTHNSKRNTKISYVQFTVKVAPRIYTVRHSSTIYHLHYSFWWYCSTYRCCRCRLSHTVVDSISSRH